MLMPAPMALPDKISHVAFHFDSSDLGNEWYHWQWHLASDAAVANGITWFKKSYCTSLQLSWHGKCNGSINDAISIMWCWHWQQLHHMTQKVLLHHILDLRNAMLPLMMLLALSETKANGDTWPKETCCISFHLSLPKEKNEVIYGAVGIRWHLYWSQMALCETNTSVIIWCQG